MDRLLSGPVLFLAVCQLLLAWAFRPRQARGLRPAARAALFFVLLAAVLILDYTVVDFNTATTALESPLCFAAAVIYLRAAWRVSWREGLYCGICSFLIAELLTQGMMPGAALLTGRLGAGWASFARVLLYAAVICGICAAARRWIAPAMQDHGAYRTAHGKLAFALLIWAVYLFVGNYQFIFWLLGYEPQEISTIITVFRLVVGAVCLCLLFLQRSMEKRLSAEQELAVNRQLWLQQQNQFQMSQANVELINRKCHDLKHQMEAIRRLKDESAIDRQLQELEQAVLLYDSAIHTGNRALDVILTEKNLACEANHITMTCMVDGRGLERLDSVDLYTMFGNALDNAVESVSRLADPEKRVIQIAAYTEGNLLMIRVRNYFEGNLTMKDGLPLTTKGDRENHGFGLKSIRYTAEKYGGTAAVQTEGNYYTLQILIPCA